MCNNTYNGCGCNRCESRGDYNTYSNTGCCGYDNDYTSCGFGDIAFAQAARINQRILTRRACEDRAAIQYLRSICGCRRCW